MSADVVNFNKDLYASLLKPKSFFLWTVCCRFSLLVLLSHMHSKDPQVRSPGTMYRHPIFLEIIVGMWFNEGHESDGVRVAVSFNPKGEGIPFQTLALVMAVV